MAAATVAHQSIASPAFAHEYLSVDLFLLCLMLTKYCRWLQRVAVCCSVLQCVAVFV